MRATRILITVLALSTFSAARIACSEEPTAPAKGLSDTQIEAFIRSARDTIDKGNPQVAITEYLDPIIESFEPLATTGNKRVFSATTLVETIFYSALGAAAADKQETLVLDGAWSSALHLKGFALIDQEKFEEAKQVLRHGIDIAPKNPWLWNELGAVYQTEMNWPEALSAYVEAAEAADLVYDKNSEDQKRTLTRALRGQGFVLIETGKLKEAEALYRRCLKVDPDDRGAKQELAYIADLRKRAR
jgi:tetratricopeptide (TPR) repeat protein